MNSATLELIEKEFSAELCGHRLGKVFQLSRTEICVDLRVSNSRYLYVSVSPGDPRTHLIVRRLKDLEKNSGNPSPFALTLKKRLSGGEIVAVKKVSGDRILDLSITSEDETGTPERYDLIIQLTGRSANVFLLSADGIILDRLRDTLGDGQQSGEHYAPPQRSDLGPEREMHSDLAAANSPSEPSNALDAYYSDLAAQRSLEEAGRNVRTKVTSEIKKREKLIARLNSDLTEHGDPEVWKRFGDLLLANAATAKRDGNRFLVTDFFDDASPVVTIESDENLSVSETAEKYYRRYTKARNGKAEIANRIEKATYERDRLLEKLRGVEEAIVNGDLEALKEISSAKKDLVAIGSKQRKPAEVSSSARSFISSDGFEILVGKKAKDNDVLTFKTAKSLDTWLHAADYPGSHVVIRNPNRKEIPQRTLLEAAQLAAFYSQGKTQVKAAVHYTLKKFVNKPKGSAPGLVSLASFKTLLVVPEFPAELDEKN